MMTRDFVDGIAFHARVTPHRPAIITVDAVVSYARLWAGAQSFARRLSTLDLSPSARIGLAVGSPVGQLTAICGLHLAGYASLTIEAAQLATLPSGVIDLLLTNFDGLAAPCPVVSITDDWFTDKCEFAPVTVDPAAISRLVLSSGTTGLPKIIGITRRAVAERVATYSVRLSRPAWERIVCVPGLSTNYGYSFAISTLWLGRAICFPSSPRLTREMIVSYQAEVLVASTQQISSMVEAQERDPLKLSTLKVVHVGGSIAYPPLLARIRMLVCSNVLCGYGSTEGGTVAYAPVEYLHGTAGAVGVVAPWIEADTVDAAGTSLGGAPGEIRLRSLGQGRRLMPDESGRYEMEPEGWFHPGDEGVVDPSGLLFVTGRINEIINRGGVKVAPDLIEQKVRELAAVGDVAAVGLLDDVGIEQICLAVVPAPSQAFDAAAVAEFMSANLPQYAPEWIVEVAEIPRNRLGKVARETLREQMRAMTGRGSDMRPVQAPPSDGPAERR
jgi:acyl-CoA synthetase (AMP-forming)/AMP-acid ligase II